MNKTIKILSIMLIAVMLVMATTPVFATGLINAIDNQARTSSNTPVGNITVIAGKVVALIRNIAVIAGVILLSVIGVKFMIGSAEEKAEYKKSLIPLVVGIVVVMAATQIMTMIVNFLTV